MSEGKLTAISVEDGSVSGASNDPHGAGVEAAADDCCEDDDRFIPGKGLEQLAFDRGN